jgi:RNA polymerase sigma-70 factor (ECF subfamily)
MGKQEENNINEIIKGCLKNERKSQKLLYDKYAKYMYRICLGYVNDQDTAQDILQDGFIKIFKNIKNYNENGSLSGWIRKIIVNTAIDYLRSKKRLDNLLEYDDAIKCMDNNNEGVKNINIEAILLKVNKLPDGARTVFNLYALEGYSHKEIAQQLEITEGTSKSQLSRAKSILKEWLQEFVN